MVYQRESREARTLGTITAESYDYRDQAKTMIKMGSDIGYISAYIRKMQRGIDAANENFVQQIGRLLADFFSLLAGNGDTGFDFGDLKYILQMFGALFGLGNQTAPWNFFEAAWHFIFTYIIPLPDFDEAINMIIDGVIATILDWFGEVPVLGEAAQQLAVWLSDFRDGFLAIEDNFWALVRSITGGIEDVAEFLGGILQHVYDTWIRPIVDAISFGVGGVGGAVTGALTSIVTNIGKIFNLASGADSKASQMLNSVKPLWETLDGNGETSTPLSSADATMVVNATNSRGGFIRCVGGDVKATISCIAFKTGTVTTCNFDVYRLESNGDLTWIYTSDDQAVNLSTTATVLFVELDEEDEFPIDIATHYLVIGRMTGSGSVTVQGRQYPSMSFLNRPYYPGLLRDPSSDPNPAYILAATVDTLYVRDTPYFQLGTRDDILPQSFYVDFSTLSTSLWLKKKQLIIGAPFHITDIYVEGGVTKIGDANPPASVGGFGGLVYRYPVATKNCRAGIRLKQDVQSGKSNYVNLFSRLDFSNFLSFAFSTTGCGIYVGTGVNAFTSFTAISTDTYSDFNEGDWIYLEHDDSLAELFVYKNPVWTDPNYRDPIGSGGSVIMNIPMSTSGLSSLNTSPSSRSGGIIMYKQQGSGCSAYVDDFILEDWHSMV